MDRIGVRKFARFTGEGLGVAFTDFEIPIYKFRQSVDRTNEREIEDRQDRIHVTCFVESTSARRNTVWELDRHCSMVIVR